MHAAAGRAVGARPARWCQESDASDSGTGRSLRGGKGGSGGADEGGDEDADGDVGKPRPRAIDANATQHTHQNGMHMVHCVLVRRASAHHWCAHGAAPCTGSVPPATLPSQGLQHLARDAAEHMARMNTRAGHVDAISSPGGTVAQQPRRGCVPQLHTLQPSGHACSSRPAAAQRRCRGHAASSPGSNRR